MVCRDFKTFVRDEKRPGRPRCRKCGREKVQTGGEKIGEEKFKVREKAGAFFRTLDFFFADFFAARLYFPSSPLSAPGFRGWTRRYSFAPDKSWKDKVKCFLVTMSKNAFLTDLPGVRVNILSRADKLPLHKTLVRI